MARLVVPVTAIAMLLLGCDPVYPPQLINAYGTLITVTLTYSDGRTTTTIWPACRAFFVGKADAQVENVKFEKDGKPLREFSANEIRVMLKSERGAPGYFAWIVSPDSVIAVHDRNEGPCPQF